MSARRPAVGLVVALATIGAGCGEPAHRQAWQGEATLGESADLLRVHQVKRALDYAWERKRVIDVEKVVSDDVVFVPPGESPKIGKQVAADWLRAWTRPILMRDTYVSEALDVAGPFAIETWTVARLVTEGEKQHRVRLKGVHVYRRQDDGRFLLERRIWNLSPARPAAQDLR